MAYEIIRFSYDGAVDADGHVLEPGTLWEEYLEEKYQDRPIRIVTDDDGMEELQINGQRSQRTRAGSLGLMGAMGEKGIKPSADRRYMDHIPFGAGNPTERVELLQQENLDRALLYPPSACSGSARSTNRRSHSPTSGPTTGGSPTSAGTAGAGSCPSPT